MARATSLTLQTLLHLLYAAPLCLLVNTDARADAPVARFNLPSEPLPQALIDFYYQGLVLTADMPVDNPIAQFSLPAQALPEALIQFYYQCGIAPGFAATEEMENAKSNAVFGVMPSTVALAQLLKGTGFTYRYDTRNTVVVTSIERPAAPVSPRPWPARAPVEYQGRLEQVMVTGSLIPGVQDVIAPLIHLQRAQLAMTDFATVQDSLYSLPIMSLNAPREDFLIDGNYQYGAGVDLRGLGVGATLVLVNGHRQPLSGVNGDFVDVSTIPLSAVKRIEVLPDGASALYGSDAIAGVVNIIMRDNFQGAESQVKYGTAIGGRREVMASQLFGTHWGSGHAMLAYQYSDTTPLAAAQRAYAANADKRPYGGANYDSYYSNPGNIMSPATQLPAYGIPAGQNGQRLTAAALSTSINLQNQFAQYQLFPDDRAHELYATAAEDFNERIQLFFEGRFAERDVLQDDLPDAKLLVVPPSNPFYVNPFATVPYTLVAYSFSRDFGPAIFSGRTQVYAGTAGAKLQIGDTWQTTLSESYGRQFLRSDEYDVADPAMLAASLVDPNPATAFDPFGDGSTANPETLAAIKRDFPRHVKSTIESTRLDAAGSLFRMPAGDAKLAVGIEQRKEALKHDVPNPLNPAEWAIAESYSRHITALFSELALPLIGNPTNPRAVPRLELDVTGRYEHYSDFGHTFNPIVRIRWVPIQALKLRASWGRSFRAPTLDNLSDSSENVAGMAVLSDPLSSTGRSLVLVQEGSNPHLKQETAKTWTAGFDFAPNFLRGSTFSLTYYSIDYENRIARPAVDNPFAILLDGAEWAPVITRNPSRAQIDAICNGPDYRGAVSQCLASSPAAIIDLRLANLATTRTTGLDAEAHDTVRSALGTLTLGVVANYVLKFDQTVTASSPVTDVVNTVGNPLALRVRGTLDWSREGPESPGPEFDLAVNYTGGYKNASSTLMPNMSPWTTVDARIVYRTRPRTGWLSGMELSVNAVNVLNHDPPFADALFGYDAYNVQALGRVVSADISKRW